MSPARGRPVTAPIRKLISLDAELVAGIELFRAELGGDINQTEAIRLLLREALARRGHLSNDVGTAE